MINSQEIKIGTCIRMDGKIWTCIDFQHRKPGKGNTVMITKLKNVSDGRVLERTFQIGFKLEDVRVERRPYQYLYEDTTGCILMNQETFEQIPVAKEQITGVEFMKEGDIERLLLIPAMVLSSWLKCLLRQTSALLTLSQVSRAIQLPTLLSQLLLRQVLKSVYLSSSTRATLFRLTHAMVLTSTV